MSDASSTSAKVNRAAPQESTAREIERLAPWFHNLHLPDGSQTAPNHALGDFPKFKWQQIEPYLPADLEGKEVLDIGCNAGYYSLELAKRGAKVTAIDIDPHYLRQARWAASVHGLDDRIEFHQMPIYQLAHWQRQFDLIWFMGVLYHLRYPLLALDIVRRRSKGMMIFQTLTTPGESVFDPQENYPLHEREILQEDGWPRMSFIEHRLANDPTNWWAPNHACVEAMLRSSGFEQVERISHEIYRCVASPSAEEPWFLNELTSAQDALDELEA